MRAEHSEGDKRERIKTKGRGCPPLSRIPLLEIGMVGIVVGGGNWGEAVTFPPPAEGWLSIEAGSTGGVEGTA